MLLWCRGFELQQLVQGFGSGLMEAARKALSMASRSVLPLTCRWAKMRHNN
jgi:hypothetical protein